MLRYNLWVHSYSRTTFTYRYRCNRSSCTTWQDKQEQQLHNNRQKTQAQQLQAQAVTPQIREALQTVQGAQVTDQERQRSQVQAQQQAGTSVADLTVTQGTATKMTNPVQREIQAGELVSPTANAEKAKAFTEQVQAATATPTDKATVAGQLATLTADFDATNPPAWAEEQSEVLMQSCNKEV